MADAPNNTALIGLVSPNLDVIRTLIDTAIDADEGSVRRKNLLHAALGLIDAFLVKKWRRAMADIETAAFSTAAWSAAWRRWAAT